MGDVTRTGIRLWSYVNVRRDREVKKSPRENMRQRQCYEPKRSVMFNQRSRGPVLVIYSQLSWLSPGHKAWRMYRNDQRAYPGLCNSDRETGLIHKQQWGKKKKKKEHASSCKTRRGIARVSTLVTGRREDLQLGGRRQEKGIKGGFVEKVPFLLGLAVKIDNK